MVCSYSGNIMLMLKNVIMFSDRLVIFMVKLCWWNSDRLIMGCLVCSFYIIRKVR